MRTIKFRAWDKVNNRIWNDIEDLGFFRREVNADKSFCGATITKDSGHAQFYSNEQLELMQFTGLLDKNGKEIYEGDLIKAEEPDFETGVFIYKVDFHDASFWGQDKDFNHYPLRQFTDIEVIGNIYENPELLNSTSDA
jgi:uncharacterized phage protein (TIGR01671 family)